MSTVFIVSEGIPMRNQRAVTLSLVLIITAIPMLVFTLVALASDMSIADTLTALSEQLSSRRLNPFISGLLGLFPFALMMIVLWIHGRLGGDPSLRFSLLLGGAIPIILVLLWANVEFWPKFLPERVSPGFPHGLELLIGPVFFAPVALLAGMLLVRLCLVKRR